MKRRRDKEFRKKLLGTLTSIIAIRFPGVDPEPFLNWVYPRVKGLFSPAAAICYLGICLAALILVLANFDEFWRKMPEFQQFFGIDNLLYMGVVLIFTKTLHELGHGLMCKHFGGECHEIGFMLLVLTPAMYCNTSDSWVMPNKWHRIAIGAGGMIVELILASICTFVWWNTQPGWLHYFCLNVMFLSSVSTVLFNLNPLLRYDGYFMLADLLEIPNLSQKSQIALLNFARSWGLGMKPVNRRLMPARNQWLFALYSVASFCYRWFIMFSIFWFLSKVFEPYGLEIIGDFMILVSLFSMIAIPGVKLVKYFSYPGRFREVKPGRTLVTTAVALVLLGLFFFLPLPHYVWAHFVVELSEPQKVFVNQAGRVSEVNFREGDRVDEGQVIARIDNPQLQGELIQLQGEYGKLEAELNTSRLEARYSDSARQKIYELIVELDSLKRRIATKNKEISDLTLVASRRGIVFCPPNTVPLPTGDGELSVWSGTPLDEANRSIFLQTSPLPFCVIGDPEELQATLVVDQADVELLGPGQRVQLIAIQNQGRRFSGEIAQVSQDELKAVPRELSKTNGGPVAVNPQRDGSEPPMITSFQARAKLDAERGFELRPGFYGVCESQSRSGFAGLEAIPLLPDNSKISMNWVARYYLRISIHPLRPGRS